jgi:hypothetical protein
VNESRRVNELDPFEQLLEELQINKLTIFDIFDYIFIRKNLIVLGDLFHKPLKPFPRLACRRQPHG